MHKTTRIVHISNIFNQHNTQHINYYAMCISSTPTHVVPSYHPGMKSDNAGYQSYVTKGSSTLDRSPKLLSDIHDA